MWENILASSIVMLVFVIGTLAVYYLVNLRGLKKRQAHFAQLHARLAPGQLVELANGIYGTTVAVGKDTVDIRVKSGAVMTVSRYAISAIISEEEQHHA
ncbi:preprotein translocase subunit YajC [Symbiobacterium thermophilum]|uniref:Preprotein translocase subunit YajC n=1 Tax=Symbiobacterium thermophilum TaxID=2734 RepID=A0A953LIS9_SYMTR|nr:preprotein translocase subunit YajC [Symbiobacterium thermophilum]MBY6277596.1 preprotein translocase subunit YajC [Symbiobacterium thermophilum]